MRLFMALILMIAVTFGCFGPVAKETQVDSELSQVPLPSEAPSAGPGEPQRAFEQEVLESQNL